MVLFAMAGTVRDIFLRDSLLHVERRTVSVSDLDSKQCSIHKVNETDKEIRKLKISPLT